MSYLQTGSEIAGGLPDIENGFLRCYYIYDVADKIDLEKAASLSARGMERVRLDLKASAAASYMQYQQAPLQAHIDDIEVDGEKARARVRIFDQGTIAVRLSIPFKGSTSEFGRLSRQLRHSNVMSGAGEDLFKKLMVELNPCFSKTYNEPVIEDYFVFSVSQFSQPLTGAELLKNHKSELACLLLSEQHELSEDEQNEALKVQYSYYTDDLSVIEWDAAFIYDNESDAEAIESILEFAHVQMVQYLTYDGRLDAELNDIYKLNLVRLQGHWLFGKAEIEKRAERLRYLIVDIRELADHATNSLKMMGDAYYARLYRGVSLRLGLAAWQEQIDRKLDSIQEIYQFIEHQSQHAQSAAMEVVIILLIMVEVIMGLLTHTAAK